MDKNVDELEALLRRAARAGYTHALVADSKFSKLDDMDSRYFNNIARVRKLAAELHLEIVPALFSIGYSNDLLWHDPNLIEGLPVRKASFVIRGGQAQLEPDPLTALKGGDFQDLGKWSWKDDLVTAENGAARIKDPKGQNARIVQKLKLTPFRQYHVSVRIKTEGLRGTPEIKVIANDRVLNYDYLGVKPTQDWQTHHVVFNSLEHSDAALYLGCWGAEAGSVWFDDAHLEEVGFVNLIRRPGAPLVVEQLDGALLVEGRDFEKLSDPLMGTKPWKGAYDVWHTPPVLRSSLPEGTRLQISYFHAVTVHEGQAMICPSEPRTLELLRDQATRMHQAWQAKAYMMSHDEVRVLNWCVACQQRGLDAGPILADNLRACSRILREVNPGGRIYVWSDMFDPNHNARKDYYLVRGDLAGSWEGLERDVIVVPWHFEKRNESLRWFAQRGHQQLIAGYYDHAPEQIRQWLEAARPVKGITGVMYTTWQRKYEDLERFAQLIEKE